MITVMLKKCYIFNLKNKKDGKNELNIIYFYV